MRNLISLRKILFVASLILAGQIFPACPRCDQDPVPFNYSGVSLKNLDNSLDYVRYNSTDTMYSAAVAFELSITGDAPISERKENVYGGMQRAYADECAILFSPQQSIEKISVYTLEDLSPDILLESDVTYHFLGLVYYHYTDDFLYKTLPELIEQVRPDKILSEAQMSFRIFLTREVKNDTARFRIEVSLSDGRTLTVESHPIVILPTSFPYR